MSTSGSALGRAFMNVRLVSLSKTYQDTQERIVPPKRVAIDDIAAIHTCNNAVSVHTKSQGTIGVAADHYPRELWDILRDAATLLTPEQLDQIPVVYEIHTPVRQDDGTYNVHKTRSRRTALTCFDFD